MQKKLRTILLFLATLLMGFGAVVNAVVVVPHLREDMIEINVRPTLLGAIALALHFSTFAMAAFTCIVLAAAIESLKGAMTSRLPLLIVGVTYAVFGIRAFALSGGHHTIGYLMMGLLVIGAAAIRE